MTHRTARTPASLPATLLLAAVAGCAAPRASIPLSSTPATAGLGTPAQGTGAAAPAVPPAPAATEAERWSADPQAAAAPQGAATPQGVVATAFLEASPDAAPPVPPPQLARRDDPPEGEPETLPPPRRLPPDSIPGGRGVDVEAGPLVLDEVTTSVERNYPLLAAAVLEQGIASGQLLAAQGAFDLNLRAREFWQVGTYDSNRAVFGVDQNLAWNGVSYSAGYRHSAGDFPIYYGDRKTGDGGEFRAALLIPLLAGRAVDRRRASLIQADLTRAIADPTIAAQRLDFVRAASRAYWGWVAAGRRHRIAQAVLKLAEDRDGQLAELVQRGAVAEIERIDNQRVVVERQGRRIAAERILQQASIALSLYLRDEAGEPRIPAASRLPDEISDPAPIDRGRVDSDLNLALMQRPELARLRLQRERQAVELGLARNQLLPGLNLGLEGYQDVGYGSSYSKTPLVTDTQLDRTTYVGSLQFDVPLQRREAQGKALAAEAAIAQLTAQERFQQDRIAAEVQDAASALERAFELWNKARENVALARRVESGERERFMKGQGTIVILNLRELVAAEASFAEVDALVEYHRSLADYRAAIGLTSEPVGEAPR